jgi:hypothetical protein
MPPNDPQQQRLLDRLRDAAGEPLALDALRAAGIDFPAAVLSELELHGYAIERVYEHGRMIGVRLVEPEGGGEPAPRGRRWPWRRPRAS